MDFSTISNLDLKVTAGGKEADALIQVLPASAPAYIVLQAGQKKVLVHWMPESVSIQPRVYKKIVQDRSWLESNLPGVNLNFMIKDEKDLTSLILNKISAKVKKRKTFSIINCI